MILLHSINGCPLRYTFIQDMNKLSQKILDKIDNDLDLYGLDILSDIDRTICMYNNDLDGFIVRPRRQEIACAINRLRSLKVIV